MLRSRFFRRAVIGPELVAERLVDAVESGKSELFVPRWYRIFALAQALFPGLTRRLVTRSGYRRPSAVAPPNRPRGTRPQRTGSDPRTGPRRTVQAQQFTQLFVHSGLSRGFRCVRVVGMSRPLRSLFPPGYYHVYARGVNRLPDLPQAGRLPPLPLPPRAHDPPLRVDDAGRSA